MAGISLASDHVEIKLRLADEILSLHGTFHVPYTHITSVSCQPPPESWFKGIKMGTNLPGVKVAGTFFTPEGTIFYDYHDAERCLTLELAHETYRRIVIEVDASQDREELRRAIEARLSGDGV